MLLVTCNRDIESGPRSVTGPDSRSRRRGNAHSFRGGATRKTAQFRPSPSGRWGLPSISLSPVGNDETASFSPHFAISTGETHRRHCRYLCYRPLGNNPRVSDVTQDKHALLALDALPMDPTLSIRRISK